MKTSRRFTRSAAGNNDSSKEPDLVNRIVIIMAIYEPNIEYLAAQLESIVKQTHTNWECIVGCDSDLSDILSENIIRPYADDKRFRWNQNEHKFGHKLNFEVLLKHACSLDPFAIAFCDQDDIWVCDKLEQCMSVLRKVSGPAMVHHDMFVLKAGEVLSKSFWEVEKRKTKYAETSHLLLRNCISGCGMVVETELARKYDFTPSYIQDHDHWMGLIASCAGEIVALNEPLAYYRQHAGNLIGIANQNRRSIHLRAFYPAVSYRARYSSAKGKYKLLRERGFIVDRTSIRLFDSDDFGFYFLLASVFYLCKDIALVKTNLIMGIGKFSESMAMLWRLDSE